MERISCLHYLLKEPMCETYLLGKSESLKLESLLTVFCLSLHDSNLPGQPRAAPFLDQTQRRIMTPTGWWQQQCRTRSAILQRFSREPWAQLVLIYRKGLIGLHFTNNLFYCDVHAVKQLQLHSTAGHLIGWLQLSVWAFLTCYLLVYIKK